MKFYTKLLYLIVLGLSLQQSLTQALAQTSPSKRVIFKQKIDHLDPSNSQTFDQRGFIHDAFVRTSNAPVIYAMCGESECTDPMSDGLIPKLARELGAAVISLEHRYYGKSHPFSNLSAANLKFLTIRQALEDFKAFHQSLSFKGPTLTIGGSYPGTLAALYRLSYPKLAIGALASSAPMILKAEFPEYDAHIAKTLGAACTKEVVLMQNAVRAALEKPEKAQTIKKLFKLESIEDKGDVLWAITDGVAIAAQYGYYESLCSALKEAETSKKLITFANKIVDLYSTMGSKPSDNTFQAMQNEEIRTSQMLRQWTYQSCREIGSFQISNPTLTSRTSSTDLAYFNNGCKKLFGFEAQTKNIAQNGMQILQALRKPEAKQIYFTNGSVDPWMTVSIYPQMAQTLKLDVLSSVMNKASHAEDLGDSRNPQVKQVQGQILNVFKKWLNSTR